MSPKEPTEADLAAAKRLLGPIGEVNLDGAEAYCVPCKAKRVIHMPRVITMRNGRPAITGDCPTCGAKVFKLGVG
jgi:hypothetical protein